MNTLSSVRPPDRLLPSHGKTRPFHVIGHSCSNVAVLPCALERLVRSVVETAGLELAAVA